MARSFEAAHDNGAARPEKGERQYAHWRPAPGFMSAKTIATVDRSLEAILCADIDAALDAPARRPLVYGVSGAQGSGKSTAARRLVEHVRMRGGTAETLSIDDLYFGRTARRRLARTAHPLFITRGPPGTHDINLGIETLLAATAGAEVLLPRYDKATDEPAHRSVWTPAPAGLDALIVEGWCLGAAAQDELELAMPVNTLERVFDADGRWRRLANRALGEGYQRFFGLVDRLVFLRAPDFDIVWRWRADQERALTAANAGRIAPGLMLEDELSYFVQHFERVTRALLRNPPARADIIIDLDARREVSRVSRPVPACA
jgi:D-glycerate 3-kinase